MRIGVILSTMSLGDHRMLVYPDNYTLNDAYRTSVKQFLAANVGVIIFPHYESLGAVRHVLQELDIDVAVHEGDHSLTIMDGDNILVRMQIEGFVDFLKKQEEAAVKEGRQGLGIIIDVGSFFHLRREVDLEKFEMLCHSGKLAGGKSTVLCCYHSRDLQGSAQDFRNQVHSMHEISYIVQAER
jgi:hypothetical protein